MRLAVLRERRAGETRVAATPETVKKLVALGITVAVEAGAGAGVSIGDADYTAAGAEIAPDAKSAAAGAGVVFAVQLPEAAALAAIPRGALLVCTSGLMANKEGAGPVAQAGIDLAAMELLPRITRAQSMDVLSSQANLAGYRAVIEGAAAFERGFPMMMTAAGTVPPARVFVLGAGVAGLQAIATARRLGAIVSATDVRPAAKEEIKSLGATFVGVEDTETAGQTGAYAKEMSDEFRRKQAELVTGTVAKNDMVICTALVQGGRAPTLVTNAMVAGMKPGSVVVDIAADAGGNCEATRPGEAYTTGNGVKILGYRNWPSRIGVAASSLYAKNLLTFLTTFWDKDAKALKLPEDDAIIAGLMVTRGGAVVHPAFAGGASPAAPPAAKQAAPAAAPKAAEPGPQASAPAAPPPQTPAASPAPAAAAPKAPEPPKPAPPQPAPQPQPATSPAPAAAAPKAPEPPKPVPPTASPQAEAPAKPTAEPPQPAPSAPSAAPQTQAPASSSTPAPAAPKPAPPAPAADPRKPPEPPKTAAPAPQPAPQAAVKPALPPAPAKAATPAAPEPARQAAPQPAASSTETKPAPQAATPAQPKPGNPKPGNGGKPKDPKPQNKPQGQPQSGKPQGGKPQGKPTT